MPQQLLRQPATSASSAEVTVAGSLSDDAAALAGAASPAAAVVGTIESLTGSAVVDRGCSAGNSDSVRSPPAAVGVLGTSRKSTINSALTMLLPALINMTTTSSGLVHVLLRKRKTNTAMSGPNESPTVRKEAFRA